MQNLGSGRVGTLPCVCNILDQIRPNRDQYCVILPSEHSLPCLYAMPDSRINWQSAVPVKEEQYGQHGLVDVTVADALVEQEARVPYHRLQRILPHDGVEFVCVEVLVHELVAQLAEVGDGGAGGAPRQRP